MTEKRWGELVDDAVGGPVTLGTMFGSKGLRTGTKYFATWWNGRLVLKVAPSRVEELLSSGHGTAFEPMEGRPMKAWVVVDTASDWAALAAEARAYVESLQR